MKNPILSTNPRVWRAANLVSCNLAAVAIVLSPAATAALAEAPSVVSSAVTERGACYAVWSGVTRSTDPVTGQITDATYHHAA